MNLTDFHESDCVCQRPGPQGALKVRFVPLQICGAVGLLSALTLAPSNAPGNPVYHDLGLNTGTRDVATESQEVAVEPVFRVDFGTDAARSHLGAGWSKDEQQGRDSWVWAEGKKSLLTVDHPFENAPHVAVFDFKHSRHNQRMTVYINGAPIGEIQPVIRDLHSSNRHELEIPKGLLVPGRNELRFEFANAGPVSPTDPRILALAFRSLEIRRPSGAVVLECSGLAPKRLAENFEQARIRWFTYLPEGAELVFGLKHNDADASRESGFNTELTIETQGSRRRLWTAPPGSPRGNDKPHRIDLSPHAGQFAYLEFLVRPTERGRDPGSSITFRDPRIEVPRLPDRPHILLITLDSLRADRVGCYGYEINTTPNIDKLAESAVMFENAITQSSWTLPSLASLLTGRYPSQIEDGIQGGLRSLSAQVHTLPELLAAQGYLTVGVTSHDFSSSRFGFQRGFTLFKDLPPGKQFARPAPELLAVVKSTWATARESGGPVFYWVHIFEPHWPYNPPIEHFAAVHPESLTRFQPGSEDHALLDTKITSILKCWKHHPEREEINPAMVSFFRDAYDANVRYGDQTLGRIVDLFAADIRLDDAIVIVASDHGESLGEDGWYFTHAQNLHPELIRVPLLLRYPRRVKPGRLETPVEIGGIAATLLSLLGISADAVNEPLSMPDLRSYSTTDIVLSELENTNNLHFLPEQDQRQSSIIKDGIQTIWYEGRSQTALEQFQLSPGTWQAQELDNHDEQLSTIQQRAHRQRGTNRIQPTGSGTTDEIPEDMKERLRALGYVE